ncbi:MAG: hypothetical protein KA369_02950 [Spirochaetes bacterium]|nr:hypothetical protein [Spirochaetota bacterium]
MKSSFENARDIVLRSILIAVSERKRLNPAVKISATEPMLHPSDHETISI